MTLVRASWLLALAAGLCGVALGTYSGARDGLLIGILLLATGALVLAAAQLVARRRSRIGPLVRQFQLGIAVAVGLCLTAIVVVALLMFFSTHDALLMALLIAFAGVTAAVSASLVGREVMRDVDAVRESLAAVGEGRRDIRCETAADDELAELADAVNAMTARLAASERTTADAWRAQRDLVAAVSHDLRTPLASLQVLAEALEDDVVDERGRRRYVGQIAIHTRSLATLVDDLFELSRLEAGDIRWSLESVQLGELVSEAVEAVEPQADLKGVKLRALLAPDLGAARANPEKLQRVLLNLVQNAIRHTPADGTVTVAAETHDDGIEVEVADTGEGIADADRARVFEPFHRGGAAAARSDDGAGLGLSICRAIVEAHGGRIWLADAAQGTRIRFRLSRAA